MRDGAEYRAELTERRNGLTITFKAAEPLSVYGLDDDAIWDGGGKRPDGVLISDVGFVCFVELKGAIDATEPERGFEQLEGGVNHFCAWLAHGLVHHERFKRGDDRPSACIGRRDDLLALTSTHAVRGILVVRRAGARRPPRVVERGGKRVRLVVIQRHAPYGRMEVTVDALRAELGL